jgi:hypothetical protein
MGGGCQWEAFPSRRSGSRSLVFSPPDGSWRLRFLRTEPEFKTRGKIAGGATVMEVCEDGGRRRGEKGNDT